MPPAIVELREVSKRFGATAPVLDRLSLCVLEREFVALIGPSGCGKSTLLRLIAGLTPLSGGVLSVQGTTPETAAAHLGFVFQDATLLPWLTVAKNIDLPLKLRGLSRPEIERRRQGALELVRLADRSGAFPRQLSGGQRMRVSLARAIALQPKLLLLDEPFGALDEMTRERLNEELLTIRERESWTAFFVTHSVSEAVFLASRVVVLSANPGRIFAEISIPLAYPRTGETRLSREYQDLVAEVSRSLRTADSPAV